MIDKIDFTKKAPRRLGLYLHIPFCRTKCLYCDFCSFVGKDDEQREAYVLALIDEIRARGTKEYTVDTIYFGGGTPSLLSCGQVCRILTALRENFEISGDVEITLEANPMTHIGDAFEYFSSLRALGVNRLSLGIQSALDEELKLIGRRHSFVEAKRSFFEARRAGFENISVDLMMGIPSQTLESLKFSIDEFMTLGAEHISIYSLQLEEGTPLYRMRQRYSLADDDALADMYELVVRSMKDFGYDHYEISNFARAGRESRHNKKYWALEEYLGLGLSAHSDIGAMRMENTRDLDAYLAGRWFECEKLISSKEREFEFIMLGLRTRWGISKQDFLERFGVDFDEKYGAAVKKYAEMGYFVESGCCVALNERGFEVSNAILSEILDFDY